MTVVAPQIQLAVFQLDELPIGIDISRIREINRVGEITPVPDAPDCVRGVINLRGEVVTVMDLRVILELPPRKISSQTRLVIVQSGAELIGLLVDSASNVASFHPEQIEPLPANLAHTGSRFFTGVCRLDAELLVVLDVEAALDSVDA